MIRALTLAAFACAASLSLQAKPLFLKQAQAAGMKDIQSCIACHTTDQPKGGPWNARGNWLRAEKVRRHALSVDIAWLKDYPVTAAAH